MPITGRCILIGQVMSYLDAMTPGKTLASLLMIDDPAVIANLQDDNRLFYVSGDELRANLRRKFHDLAEPAFGFL